MRKQNPRLRKSGILVPEEGVDSKSSNSIPNEVRNEINEGNLHVNNIDLTNHQEKDTSEKGDLSLVRSSEGVIPEHETVDFADKENAAATIITGFLKIVYALNLYYKQRCKSNVNHPQRRLGQRRPHENCQKVIDETLAKSVKGSSAMPSTAFQVVQYKKPKPTSPKPFRLRNNEKEFLEKHLEKRHIVPPIKETHQFSGLKMENRKDVETARAQSETHNYVNAQVQDVKDKGAQKVRTAAKSQLSKQQLVYTQRVAVMREATIYEIPPGRLSVIKEMSSTVSRLRAAKPATIPKESNFLKAHMGYKKMPAKTISWQ
ncbi:hypothetical protein GIB67_042820 [Kingdonia uniflora]|uniref:Uncharacterized protein n=1 Tax=Kingdonia uniflora TaxID=39325 RepID=A0A7J7LB13_9MAGN|nr:hypothetical protein GIB67_042820 [Kingdonia uniflora]